MAEDIENINKRIATFMVVSLALSAAVTASEPISIPVTVGSSQMIDVPMLRYAAPEIPSIPNPVNPPVEMYATPSIPTVPGQIIPPNEVMYGVPDIPVIEKPIQNVALYAAPEYFEKRRTMEDTNSKIEPSANLINSIGGKINITDTEKY